MLAVQRKSNGMWWFGNPCATHRPAATLRSNPDRRDAKSYSAIPKIENIVRYLGVDIADVLTLGEKTEI